MPSWWPDWPAYIWGAIPIAIFILSTLDRIANTLGQILSELRKQGKRD